jgi:hypothetical protein
MTKASHPWPHLETPLLEQLRGYPEGVSEFDLIRALQRHYELPEFGADALADPVSLYRTHFILFHVLYRLDERLSDERVEVGCLRCRLLTRDAGDSGGGALDAADPVRAYYLDLANLELDRREIERLMDGFWRLINRSDGRRASALATLGLSDPVSDDEIKAAYRRLVMRHHPDRGGDTGRIQELNEAMATLGL